MELIGVSRWWVRIRHAGQELKVYGELYDTKPPTFRLFREADGSLFDIPGADEGALIRELKNLVWDAHKVRVIGPDDDHVDGESDLLGRSTSLLGRLLGRRGDRRK